MKKQLVLLFALLAFATVAAFGQQADASKPMDKRVSKSPEFVGGTAALIDFFAKNIQYPAEAFEKQVRGQVVVQFSVEKDSSVAEAKIEKGLGFGLDEEVLRVVQMFPKWKPATNEKGEPIAVLMQIPLDLQPPKIAPKPIVMPPLPVLEAPKSAKKPVSKPKAKTKN